ncbi:AI-2E family transporter [Azohydromonas lata]|uniref:AI-2E family transporter n=1 Tax=Azohydromonas lata TaxID=45677 RepID=A0ABU5I8D8_9BURK|nr:AI-2E family transporter [Azohydromonas lata]MDZ5455353.1 AI-2E family transporter [Azohydromonas lata]
MSAEPLSAQPLGPPASSAATPAVTPVASPSLASPHGVGRGAARGGLRMEPGAAELPAAALAAPLTPAPTPWHGSPAIKGLLAIALIFLLKLAQPLLVPMVVAVVLTFLLSPQVRSLRRHGVPEVLGALVLVAALLGGTVLMGSALVTPAAQWWSRAPSVMTALEQQIDRVRRSIPILAPPQREPVSRSSGNAPPPVDPIKDRIASEGVTLTRLVLSHVLSFGFSAASTVILLYFLLASEHWMLSRTVEAIPRRRTRALVVAGVRSAQQEIGQFLGALSIINLGVALAVGGAMAYIGLPNPVLWGTVAGVLNFIPYIGPLLNTLLLLTAGLLSFGDSALLVAPAAAYLGVHAIEANVVSPIFVSKRLSLSPISVFLSVMFWGWLWGVAGAVLAVPILVGLRSVCKRNRRLRLLCVYMEGSRRPPPSLKSLLRHKRRQPRAGM